MSETTLEQRFWRQVVKGDGPDACWLWTGSNNGDSRYGWIFSHRIGGHAGTRVVYTAHRASWMIHFGPVPEGALVCHSCDVRACVRPEHLFLGTVKDNAQDAKAKGRLARPCAEPRSKLTVEIARSVKERLAAGATCTVLARELHVSPHAISDIRRGRTWKSA